MTREILINSPKYGLKIVLVDDEDFEWLSQYKWSIKRDKNKFYVHRCVKNEFGKRSSLTIHKLIASKYFGKDSHIDHINGNPLDDRKENLRECSNAQNSYNRKPKNRYKGVYKVRDKWRAAISIRINGIYKKVHIGYFDSEIEAAKAYDRKALELFGEFAYLNFPEEVE